MPRSSEPHAHSSLGSEEFDRSFTEFLTSRPHDSDADLATAIREHGRACLASGVNVSLENYLRVIDRLASRRAPLDAAIDIALRSRSGASRPDDGAVESLIEEHPDLALPIREAAVLAHALWSTGELRTEPPPETARSLPEPFGPVLDDGAPRYTLTRRLGAGASGEVYLAEDRRLSDEDKPALVAIKILRSARRDEFTRRRFAEEAAKARRLDHRGVVRVFDRAETDGGEDFIVYEFVPGGDLHDWVAQHARTIPVRRAVALVAEIARAVQAAHASGLVHLDLKPANILMAEGDQPKVADFDLARRANATERAGRAPLGTYAFMAPEQFLSEPGAAAAPADIYALAGILYWLITHRLPNGDTLDEIAERHHERRSPPIEALAHERAVDRDLIAVIRRALDPNPKKRQDSAGALANDLEAWLRRDPIRWTHPGPGRVLWLFARRRPAIFGLLVALFVALVGTVIALEAARRFASVAHHRQLEAQVAATRLEAEQEWKAKSAQILGRFKRALTQAGRTGLSGEVLTSLWLLEWVHGPAVLANPEELPRLWAQRIDIIRNLLNERRAEAGDDSLETLTLETLLGFWLTKSGRYEEAIPLLEHNLEHWRAMLAPTDPWLDDVQTILLCARASRLADRPDDLPASPMDLAQAVDIAATLRTHDTRLAPRDDGAQLRLLIQESLASLYEPELLDDASKQRQALEAADSLGLSVPKHRMSGR